MKRVIFLLLFVFVALSTSNAKITIKDTVNVTAMQKFKIPQNKNIVIANVLRIKVDAELLDAGMNPIRKCDELWQDPTNAQIAKKTRGGRGTDVQFSVFETIKKEGTYYIKLDIKVKGERGSGRKVVYYFVNVKLPEVAAPIDLSPKGYFYSQKKTFSFATIQFKDPSLYSYKIFDGGGNVIGQNKGSVVKLDSVLSDLKYVGSKIKVVGYYNGEEFDYREIGSPDVHKSEWEISILKPEINDFTDWRRTDNKSDAEPVIISAYNRNAMRILYSYFGKTDNGFVVIQPQVKGFRLTSEPKGLVINARPTRAGSWLYVQFELSKDYLDGIEEYGEIETTIHVRFRTQFGETIDRTYDATIYK